MLVQHIVQANKKENTQARISSSLLRWSVDLPHQGPVMQKAVACRDIIMKKYIAETSQDIAARQACVTIYFWIYSSPFT